MPHRVARIAQADHLIDRLPVASPRRSVSQVASIRRGLPAEPILRSDDDVGACPAPRSASTSDRAITMCPPSAIGGLDVTTAMRMGGILGRDRGSADRGSGKATESELDRARSGAPKQHGPETSTVVIDIRSPRLRITEPGSPDPDAASFHQHRLHAHAEVAGVGARWLVESGDEPGAARDRRRPHRPLALIRETLRRARRTAAAMRRRRATGAACGRIP